MAACRNPSKLLPSYTGEVRVGDLRDPDYLDRVLVGIDIICHAAGWSSFEDSGDTSSKAYLEPTLELINHAIEWRVSRFVNLSSIFVTPPDRRSLTDRPGKPQPGWPMLNCLIAVEDYIRQYQQSRCQFINLRLGLYSGKRLHMGLLPLLLEHSKASAPPYIQGRFGYFPLVDGRDIGQAFARAALAPIDAAYSCLNITGAESPTHLQFKNFSQQHLSRAVLGYGLPSFLASPVLRLKSLLGHFSSPTRLTPAMLAMLKSPTIDITPARQLIGYDPETSWQASLVDTFESYNNQLVSTAHSEPYRDLEPGQSTASSKEPL